MRVLLLSRYTRLGPSSRVRSYQFLPALRAAGIEVEADPLLGDRYMRHLYRGHGPATASAAIHGYVSRLRRLLTANRYDLLWIEKELMPWLPGWLEWMLLHHAPPYVIDFDDAIFHRYDQHPNPIVRSTLGSKLAPLIQGAAAVVVGNSYLGDYMWGAGARTVVEVPSVVDVHRYSMPHSSRFAEDDVRIGWIGNPGTSHYLQLVRSALESVTRSGRVVFVTIGAAENEPLTNIRHLARPWTEASEVCDLRGLDIGIMPLPDRPVERGKCGYKIVQYMACGIPTVASPVGANTSIVKHGQTGFLASDNAEWTRCLEQLVHHPDLAQRMGRAARTECERHYSHQQVVPRLVDLFDRVASRGVKPNKS